jgi:glycine cleavage system H protein
MSDADRIFMMGQYAAALPADRRYVDSHLWFQPGDGPYRVGFTAYAVRLLQDVYFLDWQIDPETVVRKKQAIGEIESSKAVSTLYAPAAGRVCAFNPALMDNPSLINSDPYGTGWLYAFETDDALLSLEAYYAHLEATWEQTQKVLKGQYNDAG